MLLLSSVVLHAARCTYALLTAYYVLITSMAAVPSRHRSISTAALGSVIHGHNGILLVLALVPATGGFRVLVFLVFGILGFGFGLF